MICIKNFQKFLNTAIADKQKFKLTFWKINMKTIFFRILPNFPLWPYYPNTSSLIIIITSSLWLMILMESAYYSHMLRQPLWSISLNNLPNPAFPNAIIKRKCRSLIGAKDASGGRGLWRHRQHRPMLHAWLPWASQGFSYRRHPVLLSLSLRVTPSLGLLSSQLLSHAREPIADQQNF